MTNAYKLYDLEPAVDLLPNGQVLMTRFNFEEFSFDTQVFGDLGDSLGPISRIHKTSANGSGATEAAIRAHNSFLVFSQENPSRIHPFLEKE